MRRISGRLRAANRPLARDAGLVLLLAAASFALGARPYPEIGTKFPGVDLVTIWNGLLTWWWLAAGPGIVALLIHRRWPVVALGLAALSASGHLLVRDIGLQPLDLATLMILYGLTSAAPTRRRGLVALAALLVALYPATLAALLDLGPAPLDTYIRGKGPPVLRPVVLLNALEGATGPALVLGIAWAVADNHRTRRLHLATLAQRAADLQRERDQRAALAVAAERARITRELHDVVAHGISVMVVQAQGAAAALRRHPERTEVALGHVIDTGRSSLAEMRRLLGLVRHDGGPRLDPQPGIGVLPALVDQVRAAGPAVTLLVEGEPAPLPASVDLSAYRIVQEALTNTLKHAGPDAHAEVRLGFTPTHLAIEVTDDGRAGPRSTVDGNGLRGLEERVAALGGAFTAGPREGGGFAVRARLPIDGGAP